MFFMSKNHPTFRVKVTLKRVKTTHERSKINPIFGRILTPDWELKELFFRSKKTNLELNQELK